MGGPWMNYPTPRVEEIRQLLAHTRKVQGEMLALAGAIAALDATTSDPRCCCFCVTAPARSWCRAARGAGCRIHR